MLLKGITAVAAVTALLECMSTELTAMPGIWRFCLGFCGYFGAFLLLAFLFLVVVSYGVPKDNTPEKDSPFYRWVIAVYVELLIQLLRVRVKTEGLGKTPKEGRFLLVCNHLFLADPGILLHFFRDSQLAFISKKENHDMFCVGPLMNRILCQELDRNNDRQALQVILKCIRLIKNDEVSIGVFPEGYTSKDGKVHPFRSGVFKIAQKADVPIVVCTIRGTREIFKNARKLKPTDVQLHLVDVIPASELKGRTTAEISHRIYEMMIGDLGEDWRWQEE